MVTTMPKRNVLSNPDRAGDPLLVFGGIDTHADTHTVAAISYLGEMLGHASFPATPEGYRQLDRWLAGHGPVVQVGVEGTSSYGAGLAAALTGYGVELVEVNRPNRATRRVRGKSDPIDAEAAARAVLAGVATAVPKAHSGVVEAIRVIFVARRGAVRARTAAINTLHQMIITAPLRLATSCSRWPAESRSRRAPGSTLKTSPTRAAPPDSRCAGSPDESATSPPRSTTPNATSQN